jgi:hypothetical protein
VLAARPMLAAIVSVLGAGLTAGTASAGPQQYEPLSDAVRTALAFSVSDTGRGATGADASAVLALSQRRSGLAGSNDSATQPGWLETMAAHLPARWKPSRRERIDFLETVHYEALRAGLDPHLVLGLIEVESGFRRYAISDAGARGYMQVMPFWTGVIGDRDPSKLFDMRANLRYGCTILRHYLDLERGNLFRALGRYNGSLGQAEYPNKVLAAWRRWEGRTPASPPAADRRALAAGGLTPSGRGRTASPRGETRLSPLASAPEQGGR